MKQYSDQGLSCFNCVGNCCTFTSNTMMIKPLEAFDILTYLFSKEDFDLHVLIARLEKNIDEFRLNYESNIRKTYTCPFYTGENKGCTISRHSKPYGCLAFVPNESGVIEGSTCSSKQDALTKRKDDFKEEEDHLNQILIEELNLDWIKLPIPLAVLELIKKGEHLLS